MIADNGCQYSTPQEKPQLPKLAFGRIQMQTQNIQKCESVKAFVKSRVHRVHACRSYVSAYRHPLSTNLGEAGAAFLRVGALASALTGIEHPRGGAVARTAGAALAGHVLFYRIRRTCLLIRLHVVNFNLQAKTTLNSNHSDILAHNGRARRCVDSL